MDKSSLIRKYVNKKISQFNMNSCFYQGNELNNFKCTLEHSPLFISSTSSSRVFNITD